MRGQKSRSGSGTRPGFEGGQLPMYRKLPKLKGICGGECYRTMSWLLRTSLQCPSLFCIMKVICVVLEG